MKFTEWLDIIQGPIDQIFLEMHFSRTPVDIALEAEARIRTDLYFASSSSHDRILAGSCFE